MKGQDSLDLRPFLSSNFKFFEFGMKFWAQVLIFCNFFRDVNPLGELKYTHKFIPRAIGTQRWVGTFSSRELVDIVGVCMVEVDP